MVASVMGMGCAAESEDDPSADGESAADPDEGPSNDAGEGDPPLDVDACMEAADAASSGFLLDVGDWELDEFFSGTLEATCSITAVDSDAEVITTTLDCMDGDAGPYEVTLAVAAAPGTPAWAVDDDVDLFVVASENQGGLTDEPAPHARTFIHSGASLRRQGDGALLIAGADGDIDIEELFAPLVLASVGACGEVEPCSSDEDEPVQYSLREGDGAPILVTGGHHAELPLADGSTLVIDAPRAHVTSDCHFGEDVSFAARRMAE
jgi:hypothetical protein